MFLVASCCINKNLPELLETGKSFAFQRPWQSPWCHSKLHGDAPRTVVPVGVPTKDTLGIVRVWLPHFQHTVLKRFSIRSKVIFIHSLNWSPGKNYRLRQESSWISTDKTNSSLQIFDNTNPLIFPSIPSICWRYIHCISLIPFCYLLVLSREWGNDP